MRSSLEKPRRTTGRRCFRSRPAPKKGADDRRRTGRIDVQAAIEGEDDRVRSLASMRRQRERERRQAELERFLKDLKRESDDFRTL